MGKNRKRRGRYSGISDHKRVGTQLVPLLGRYEGGVSLIEWDRCLIPEHLWIAALAENYGLNAAPGHFNALLDALDEVWPHPDSPPIGFITDFGEVPNDARVGFARAYRQLILATFLEPLGRILAFYPNGPASWLIDKDYLKDGGSLDAEVELPRLRILVEMLLPGNDGVAGRMRVLPFTRLFNHGKIQVPGGIGVLEAMPRYPRDCTDKERGWVESFCRTTINVHYQMVGYYQSREWPKYFWRHNYELLPCKPADLPVRGSRPVTKHEFPTVIDALGSNGKAARSYLVLLRDGVPCDLYAPEKDEILFGLISRAIRLFILMMEDPYLWARDTSGIMLRCLAETAITFAYLVKCRKDKDFERFRNHGEGQEKLLMLHLQDTYPEDTSLDGRTSDAISDEFGGLQPELISMELGSWSKKDTRKLAREAGMEKLYRLVFSPTSADVHGSWLSLKHSNLSYCTEPLHRFHRVPTYGDPPLYVYVMRVAQALINECLRVGIDSLNYPEPQEEFPSIPWAAKVKGDGGEKS